MTARLIAGLVALLLSATASIAQTNPPPCAALPASLGYQCKAVPLPINGVCGPANGSIVAVKPTTGLCNQGTPGTVTGTGPWQWLCKGLSGGTNASCMALATVVVPPPGSGCVAGAAFCEQFTTPAAVRGRGGDLDPTRWATARISGEIISSGLGVANPVMTAPVPVCRSGVTASSVYPPDDTLICDAAGKVGQLQTATAMQNYGVNSYMVRQPFDFAGRTGKITFDVDAVVVSLGGFIELELTADPAPATTYREVQNNEAGPAIRNGLSLKLLNACGSIGASPVNTMVYNNGVGTIIAPTFDHANGCAATMAGALNHFEVHVSQTHIDVYGTDPSTDGGATFPAPKLLYSANVNLPFSRSYVHFNARNHASIKYGFGPDAVYHWDNISFDGPVLPAPRGYEAADNTAMGVYNGNAVMNLGYLLLDGTTGKPAGMYDPVNRVNTLAFSNVNTSGATAAQLTLNAAFNAQSHVADTSWGIKYRFNGGTWRNRNLTAADLAQINAIAGSPFGMLSMLIDVPVTDVISGNNTIEFQPLNAPMDYPPVVTNIDLLVSATGTSPPPVINGQCGAANGTTVSVAPNTNLCSAGSPGTVTGAGPWDWPCNGANGGTDAACHALLASVPPPTGNCGMQTGTPMFCDTFDTKKAAGVQSRTGDLDPNVWGVSRATGFVSFDQFNGWAVSTPLQSCSGLITVTSPGDVTICNGQLREATNDNPLNQFDAGTVLTLAMYPKQPFDFAGRTGTVSFDVSNDLHSIHQAWPEFWMSNLPVPTPFNHFDTWQALPQHGFGVRFGAAAGPNNGGSCQNNNNIDKPRWTVDSAVVVRNYVMDDTVGLGGVRTNMTVQQLDCVIAPAAGSGILNHVELKISQNLIEVWASDAGATALRKIATVTNANLTLSRGLIWLEDVHYNADKGDPPSQKQHTFVWDNVAFDGPFTYRDFSYDALDANAPIASTAGAMMSLGKMSQPNQTASWDVLGLPANRQATAVRVLFNFHNVFESVPATLNVTVNGNAHVVPNPFTDGLQNTWRTMAVTIPITDLVTGTNTVLIGSSSATITSNVNIVLVDVPGGVPVLPGSNNKYPL